MQPTRQEPRHVSTKSSAHSGQVGAAAHHAGLRCGAVECIELSARDQKARSHPLPGDPLAKSTFSESTSSTSGLTYYDLKTGAKFVYPLLTPLRNEIPRVSGKGGIQANLARGHRHQHYGVAYRRVRGNRGGVQAVSTADYSAAYKGIGIETSVDFEAQYAGMGFDDVKAIGAKVGLEACMLGEELLILGGDIRWRWAPPRRRRSRRPRPAAASLRPQVPIV